MIDCLRAVCRADIAIFDVTGGGTTGIEPGVMLLLGVRAVARRGVSICSVDHDPAVAHAAATGTFSPVTNNTPMCRISSGRCARRYRPCRRPADQRNELASPHR
jgi:hypothetical protein